MSPLFVLDATAFCYDLVACRRSFLAPLSGFGAL